MSNDGNTATFVGTMLESGDGFTLCDECLVAWSAALLQAMTGVDPAPFLAAVSDDEVTVEEVEAAEAAATVVQGGNRVTPPTTIETDGRTSSELAAAGTDDDPDDSRPAPTADTEPSTA